MVWGPIDASHVITTRSVGVNQAVENLGTVGRLRQAASTKDQLATYNPAQHGNHIATNVTAAKFDRLSQADPLTASAKDQRRADRILTAAGVPTAGIDGPTRIRLGRVLVSHDQLARNLAAVLVASTTGAISTVNAQQLLDWATDAGPLKAQKLALTNAIAHLLASDLSAGRPLAFGGTLVQLGTTHPTFARQLATLADNVIPLNRPAVENLATVADRRIAGQMAALARESPGSLPALNAMIAGGAVNLVPANLAANFNSLQPLANSQTARQALLEIFRATPALTCKDNVWSVNAAHAGGVNLDGLRDNLNALQERVLSSRLTGLSSAAVNLAAHNLAGALHLTDVEKNRFLNKVANKLEFGDASSNQLQTEVGLPDSSSLLKIWAETATTAQIDAHVTGLSATDKVTLLGRLMADGTSYPGIREGTDRLLTSLETRMPVDLQPAVLNLRSGYWNRPAFATYVATHPQNGPLDFQSTRNQANIDARTRFTGPNGLQTSLIRQGPAISNRLNAMLGLGLTTAQFEQFIGMTPARATALRNALANPVTLAQADVFAQRYGSDFAVPRVTLPTSANQPMQPDDKQAFLVFDQIIRQMDAATNSPADFVTGLERIAMTLPTAGKRLEDLTFVPTMVRELQATLTTGGQAGRLGDFPILIFDQTTDANIRQANNVYLTNLAATTGARIEHVTLATIQQFETALGVPGMFDTTHNNKAGYAGARNIANLLGPLLHRQLQNHPGTTVANVLANPPANLKVMLQQAALSNQDLIVMGDDDASVLPGFLQAKALIANDNPNSYITTKTFMDGRGTTSAQTINDPTNLLVNAGANLRQIVMGNATWNRGNINPVMAAACSSPGACINLPTPSEESHFSVYQTVVDGLSRATHHAGDRYEDLPSRLKGFVSYSSQGALADALLDCGQNYGNSRILPWNSAVAPLPDLSAIFNFAAQANVRQGMQKAFFARLLDFDNRGALRDLRTTNYNTVIGEFLEKEFDNLSPTERREFDEIRTGYQAAQVDLQRGIDFRDQFVQQLQHDFNALPMPHDAAWGPVDQALQNHDPTANQQMLDYLVDRNHNFSAAADQVRLAMAGGGNDPSVNASPLAQIVFLTSKAIGGGEFNQHLYDLTH